MINYKELFQLAESKGYILRFEHFVLIKGASKLEKEIGITKHFEENQLLELALIAKWMRDSHDIHIELLRLDDSKQFTAQLIEPITNYRSYHKKCNTYEEALTAGLKAALNLI
jgi:hypothetical protein